MERKRYNVCYSTSFNKELVEIVDYLSHTLNKSSVAIKLIDELEEKIKILTVFPYIFSSQLYNEVLMYKFKIQNYSIFYSVKDSTIIICHIFYSKSNLSNLLNSIK